MYTCRSQPSRRAGVSVSVRVSELVIVDAREGRGEDSGDGLGASASAVVSLSGHVRLSVS